MKTENEHSKWSPADMIAVVIAWIIAIALVYTLVIKFRIIIKH